MIQITERGIYEGVPETDYHLDPVAPSPSLSSSIAKVLTSRSPRHAWYAHPRLNKSKALEIEEREPTATMDFGSAVHAIALGAGKAIKEIPFDDFKKKAAQEMRDAARAAGQVPIKSATLARAREVAVALREQVAQTEFAGIFDEGAAEVTLAWQDLEDVWCRARVDWLPASARQGGHIIVPDIKTTGESADPEEWPRHGLDMGYDFQDALYKRGLKELIPGVRSVRFPFFVIEQDPPYGLSIFEMSGHTHLEAEELLDVGMGLWSTCLKRDNWPGYPTTPNFIDPPKWRSERGLMRKLSMQRRIEKFMRPLNSDITKAA